MSADRMAVGVSHEYAVLSQLTARGWTAEPFGQGQLSQPVREMLQRTQSPARWMPDIIACRRTANQVKVVLVDAKGGDKWLETGNHDIEIRSASAGVAFSMFAQLQVYYAFTDQTVITPAEVIALGREGLWRGRGSGTPFMLVPVDRCTSFDAAFGPPVAAPQFVNPGSIPAWVRTA